MITWHTTRELYAEFLRSDFWVGLSRRKRGLVGLCERCGERDRLQSHHVRYPENWFETRLEDLMVLCRGCHEKEHGVGGKKKPKKPAKIRVELPVKFKRAMSQKKQLNWDRSKHLISREDYLRKRQELISQGKWGKEKPKQYGGWWSGMYEGRLHPKSVHC